jgi:hypothetical protein
VEGVYLLRSYLRRYWDFAIVETPRNLQLARLTARGENDGWIARWAAAEDCYETVERPDEAVHLIINGLYHSIAAQERVLERAVRQSRTCPR